MSLTVSEVVREIGKCPEILPRWLRPLDAVRYSGFGRSHLYALIAERRVRSVCLRENGRLRGARLIDRESLDHYILTHSDTACSDVTHLTAARKKRRQKQAANGTT